MRHAKCEVVPVVLEQHPNADTLSIVKVFDSYQVVVKTDEWKDRTVGVYVEPESVVPDTEQFAWLEGKRRITARRFRGEWSYGLLIPAPPGTVVGQDVGPQLNIIHYEPPPPSFVKKFGSRETDEETRKPKSKGPHYDIQNWRKFSRCFLPDENVVVTEKIHGCNSRLTYQNGEFHVASRTMYRKKYFFKDPPKKALKRVWHFIKHSILRVPREVWNNDSFYWKAWEAAPEVMAWAKAHPGTIIYGEIYGQVQKGFPYDSTPEEPYRIRVFDICEQDPKTGTYEFWDWWRLCEEFRSVIPPKFLVPVDYIGVYSGFLAGAEEYIGAKSQLTSAHIREGVVIKPCTERRTPAIGRLILKAVSPKYLDKLRTAEPEEVEVV